MSWSGVAGDERSPWGGGRPGPGLAVLTALAQGVGTTITARGQAADLDWFGYVLLIGSGLLLADRRKQPRATMVLATAAALTYQVLDYPSGPTFLAMIVAATAAVCAGRRGTVGVVVAVA